MSFFWVYYIHLFVVIVWLSITENVGREKKFGVLENKLIRVLSNHIKKMANKSVDKKGKSSWKVFLCRDFGCLVALRQTFMTLKNARCSCCLLCTSPHSHSTLCFSFRKYMHEQSYFTQFYDMKKRTNERKKEAKELLIFTLFCLFLLFHFLLIASVERGKLCVERNAEWTFDLAQISLFLTADSAKLSTCGRFSKLFCRCPRTNNTCLPFFAWHQI